MTQQEHKPTGIRLEGISKTFYDRARGTVEAVRTVDLDVQPGELTTLLGPSGCGKTTLLRMVAGFEEPTTGKIIIADRDQTHVMANQRDIGFVFQNYALFPHMTVFDNVAYGLKLKGAASSKLTPAVRDVLDMVGLTGMERRFPNQLSGGEQQRVALARVIVTRPRVLLFDEPLSNLDAKRRVQMREEIRQLQKTLSITSLYVTHDQEEALAISDRIVVMNKGRIEQIGTPQEIYANPRSVFVANFVGKTNVLPGTVRSVDGESLRIDSLGQTFRLGTEPIADRAGIEKTLAAHQTSAADRAAVDSRGSDRAAVDSRGSDRAAASRSAGGVGAIGSIEASGSGDAGSGGSRDAKLRSAALPLRPGDEVFVLIRPEAINIAAISSVDSSVDPSAGSSAVPSAESAGNSDALRARVKTAIYLGEKAEYDLEVEGQQLKAVVYDPQKTAVFEPGAEVAVHLPGDRMSVVRD